jgi:hypothetical protein
VHIIRLSTTAHRPPVRAYSQPAIAAMWSQQNKTAMVLADQAFYNISANFKYNGFVPVSDTGCVHSTLHPFCSGYGECGGLLTQYCNSTRGNATACGACVAAAPWAIPTHNMGSISLFPNNGSCAAADVARFCGSTAPLPQDTSVATCNACTAKLAEQQMTCHILHAPVENMSVLRCMGCGGSAPAEYCAGLSKPVITHDFCWQTRSADTAKCGFGLPLEQSFVVRGFSLFDPTSSRVLAGKVASWSPGTTAALRELWLGVVEAQVVKHPNGAYRSEVWGMFGSENIDTSNQVGSEAGCCPLPPC